MPSTGNGATHAGVAQKDTSISTVYAGYRWPAVPIVVTGLYEKNGKCERERGLLSAGTGTGEQP